MNGIAPPTAITTLVPPNTLATARSVVSRIHLGVALCNRTPLPDISTVEADKVAALEPAIKGKAREIGFSAITEILPYPTTSGIRHTDFESPSQPKC